MSGIIEKVRATCTRCGHSSDRHSFDDAQTVALTDPKAKFRCNVGLLNRGEICCGCTDFRRQR